MELKIELKRFLKNNIKTFIVTTIALFAAVIGLLVLFEFLFTDSSTENEENHPLGEEIYTTQFEFYIENPDGSLFSNPSIIEENIILSEVYEEVENSEDVELVITEDEQLETDANGSDEEEQEEVEDIYLFDILRDSNSGRYTFVVFQDNLNDSRDAASAFYDLIDDNEIGVLENKNTVMFTEPYLLEEDEDESAFNDTSGSYQYFSINYIVVGLALSLFVSGAFIILKDLTSKTINYYFSYDADKYEHFVLIDKELKNRKYLESLTHSNQSQLFLSNNTVNEIGNLQDVETHNELITVSDINQYDEIVIFVIPFKTTKLWYKKQKEFLGWYNKPIKIIQVND